MGKNIDNRKFGKGGAPTRCTTLPTNSKERKQYPVARCFMDYFPDAIVAVANTSYLANEQHNPGQEPFWNRELSDDEADTMMRHFLARGTFDEDGLRHSAKMAWRAMAILQKEIEAEQEELSQEDIAAGNNFGAIADGPYCEHCGELADYKSSVLKDTHYCRDCVRKFGPMFNMASLTCLERA